VKPEKYGRLRFLVARFQAFVCSRPTTQRTRAGGSSVHLLVTFVRFFLRSVGMTGAETGSSAPARPQAAFNTTHWSVVLAVSQSDSPRAQQALAKLCQTYWYPLYAYVRRRGYSAPDAQDLTQAFFEQLLERRSLTNAAPELGKFRSYLLTAMKHFLASEWKHGTAQKRGGGAQMLSLDWARAAERFDLEPATHASPDKLFEKQWAVTVLGDVLNRLEREYRNENKAELFTALKQTLMGQRETQPYAELARQLGMSESAVKVTVHRLRKRYRELIHDEIANTLGDPTEVEAEMRYLFHVLAGG
jgi:RNA polymerase sigma-70 factor (ECF subfamily)